MTDGEKLQQLRQRIHDLAMKYHTHPDEPVTVEDVVADLTTILEADADEETL